MKRNIDLYVVAERDVFKTDNAWLSALSLLAGLDVPGLAVQVRTSREPPQRAAALARDARAATLAAPVPILLNGTLGPALGLGFDGVHWPEALIPQRHENRTYLRGASVHSPEAAARAEAAGADFLVAGTIFDARSKPAPGAGLERLRAITSSTGLPVLAIGGVTPQRVASCVDAGAAGVAVVSAVLEAPDMAAAVRDLREALDAARAVARQAS